MSTKLEMDAPNVPKVKKLVLALRVLTKELYFHHVNKVTNCMQITSNARNGIFLGLLKMIS